MATGNNARTIIIAMDGSEQSQSALNYYHQQAAGEGDDVILVYAAEHGSLASQPMFTTDPQYVAHMVCEEEGEMKRLIQRIAKMMEDAGVKGRVERYSANTPGEAVIKAARELRANLIVTGTRGLGKLRRTLMGSVSQYIVHHSHVPVLVCRDK